MHFEAFFKIEIELEISEHREGSSWSFFSPCFSVLDHQLHDQSKQGGASVWVQYDPNSKGENLIQRAAKMWVSWRIYRTSCSVLPGGDLRKDMEVE